MSTQNGELVTYEDGDALVVCEKSNPKAWVRSDTYVAVREGDRDRAPPA